MGAQSNIEWTDATWNPIGGCSIRSPGCKPCYAQKLAGTRLKNHPLYAGTTTPNKDGKPVFNGKLTVAPDDHPVWQWPLRWRGAKHPVMAGKVRCKACGRATAHRFMMCDRKDGEWCRECFDKTPCGKGRHGEGCPTLIAEDIPSLIFVGDMSDLFHEDRPKEHIDRVFRVAGRCDDLGRTHIFQLLTKRAGVMAQYIETRGYAAWNGPRLATEAWPARKIWLGFSAERQREFNERWPSMRSLARDGWTIFVSYEPAIGPLVLPDDFLAFGQRAQVIAGGMSGNEATPAHPEWFRGVRDQCSAAGVPFFFKQWGEWLPGHHYTPELKRRDSCQEQSRYACMDWDGDKSFETDGLAGWDDLGDHAMWRVGKKAAGRLLDGREHSEFPKVSA